MKVHLTALDAMKYGGIALVGIALVLLVALATEGARTSSTVTRMRARYTTYIDRSLRVLSLGGSGRIVLYAQIAGVVSLCAAEAFLGRAIPYWYAGLAVIAGGPAAYLAMARRRRVEVLESQVDGFILTLSNALRTVPSPTAALQSIVPYVPSPTREELERTVKEMRVGNTLEQSLVNMSARIGSRQLDMALSSVLVSLQVGGNLPNVLETTAGTIRDMRRLEGVVQAKTGESRAQLWILAAFPFLICGGFESASPGFFEPLQHGATGLAVIVAAVGLWVSSLLLARKVLSVDI